MKIRLYMGNSLVFLDSSIFKAFIDNKDDFHKKSLIVLSKLGNEKCKLVTSNFIIDETFTLIRAKCGLEQARKLHDTLREFGGEVKIYRVLVCDEAKAWVWFWKPWRNLSFTDCTSFALMKRLGIKCIATFDKHFSRAGFDILG